MRKLLKYAMLSVVLMIAGVALAACDSDTGGGGDGKTLAAPTGMNINSELLLAWDAVADANYYLIKINSETAFSVPNTPTNFSLASRMTEYQEYSIGLRAIAAGDDIDSGWAEISHTTSAPTLSVPSNVRFESGTKVCWDAVTDAASYIVSIGSVTAGDFVQTASFQTISLNYSLQDIPAGDFAVRVKAKGDGTRFLDSEFSAVKEAAKLAAPVLSYAEGNYPGNFGMMKGVRVSWLAIPDATQYSVNYSFSGHEKFEGYTGYSTIENYIDLNYYFLEGLFEYVVQVYAVGNNEDFLNSDFSDKLSFTTGIPGLRFSDINGGTAYEVGSLWLYNQKMNGVERPTLITVPDSIFGKPVTRLENGAFYENDFLTEVILPDSITEIGGRAFYGCTGLASITIPKNVTDISTGWSSGAFIFCSGLVNISVASGNTAFTVESNCLIRTSDNTLIVGSNIGTISTTATAIAPYAFYNCTNLTAINFSDNLTSIGDSAFYGCTGLTNIDMPKNVSNIHNAAFINCSSLASISVAPANTTYESIQDCLIRKSDNTLVLGCKNSIIPVTVTSIGVNAFYGCIGLTGISLNNVQSIGGAAFRNCTSLGSITIPSGITEIPSYAFYGCTDLAAAVLPASVKTIGSSAFSGCTSLTNVDLSSVTSIGSNAFYNCTSLGEVIFGNDIKTIDGFEGCTSLTRVIIPSSLFVNNIADTAFRNCSNLTEVVIGFGIAVIGDRAFAGTKLNAIYLHYDVAGWWYFTDKGEFVGEPNPIMYAPVYYYSATPVYDGEHWYYDSGVPTVWTI